MNYFAKILIIVSSIVSTFIFSMNSGYAANETLCHLNDGNHISTDPNNHTVYAITKTSAGDFIVGGTFRDNTATVGGIAKFTENGNFDVDFMNNIGVIGGPSAGVYALSPLDKFIYVGGSFLGLFEHNGLKSFNPDGTINSNFNLGGYGFDKPVYALSSFEDKFLIVGGAFASYNYKQANGLIRLYPDGSIDYDFLSNIGNGFNGVVYAIAVQKDGYIYVGGDFTEYNGYGVNNLVRLQPNGELDTSFVYGTDRPVRAIAIDDKNIYIGGDFTEYNGNQSSYFVVIDSQGDINYDFDMSTGFDKPVYSIHIDSSNRILVGGSFNNYNNQYAPYIVRLLGDASMDNSLSIGDGFDSTVYAISTNDDGSHIAVGGSFLQYNNGSRPLFALLGPCANTPSPFDDPNAFITTWNTANPGTSAINQITIPGAGIGYNYSVYREQVGNPSNNGTIGPITTSSHTITFPSIGIYRVAITGSFPRIYFNNGGDRNKILSVEQWGTGAWTSMAGAFRGASNMDVTATDAPNFSTTGPLISLGAAFRDATNLVGSSSFNNWDTSRVYETTSMFNGAHNFNQPLNNWNLSNVTHMASMFNNARVFNQPLNNRNTSNVTDMSFMFNNARAFNQPIGNWDTSNVTNMQSMFENAYTFEQNLGSWDVSKVLNMNRMFYRVTLDTVHYDAILTGWSSQILKNGVPFDGGYSKYCLGIEHRQSMISLDGWTITDGGFACTVINFDLNGGSGSIAPLTIYPYWPIGTLPTPPVRPHYTFNGRWTAATGGVQVTSASMFATTTTVYAQWLSAVSSSCEPYNFTNPAHGPININELTFTDNIIAAAFNQTGNFSTGHIRHVTGSVYTFSGQVPGVPHSFRFTITNLHPERGQIVPYRDFSRNGTIINPGRLFGLTATGWLNHPSGIAKNPLTRPHYTNLGPNSLAAGVAINDRGLVSSNNPVSQFWAWERPNQGFRITTEICHNPVSTQTGTCVGLPANAVPFSGTTITQSLLSGGRLPSTGYVYSETPSTNECYFTCDTNYSRNGSACVADTQVVECTGTLPANTIAVGPTTFTQTWSGSAWDPANISYTYTADTNSTQACTYSCPSATHTRNPATQTCTENPVYNRHVGDRGQCPVVPTDPINGVCGAAHQVTSATMPNFANLCTSGTPTSVILSSNGGRRDWQCLGSNSGSDALCRAPTGITTESCSKCQQQFPTGPQTCGSAGSASESVCNAIQGQPGPSDPIQDICYWDENACSTSNPSQTVNHCGVCSIGNNAYVCQDGFRCDQASDGADRGLCQPNAGSGLPMC